MRFIFSFRVGLAGLSVIGVALSGAPCWSFAMFCLCGGGRGNALLSSRGECELFWFASGSRNQLFVGVRLSEFSLVCHFCLSGGDNRGNVLLSSRG